MSRQERQTHGEVVRQIPLRHLHPQVHRGGPGAGVQLPGRPAGVGRGVHQEPGSTKAGTACPTATTTAASPAATWTARRCSGCMADIEAGKVDCVVVYKVDRLSRSLLDFARMMETFERHQRVVRLGHPAVQHGHVDGPADAERAAVLRPVRAGDDLASGPATRSPPRGARASGRAACRCWATTWIRRDRSWWSTRPRPTGCGQIFELYLEHEALLPVVQELERRGWRNKRWTTRKGTERGGRPFDKNSLCTAADQRHLHRQGQVQGRSPRRASTRRSSTPRSGSRSRRMLQRNGRTGGARSETSSGRCSRGCCAASPATAP